MTSETTLILGALIKFIRKAQNFSQAEFGKNLGVSQSAVNDMERGKSLSPKNRQKLAAIFEVSESTMIKSAEDLFSVFVAERDVVQLICYMIGAMDTHEEEVTGTNIIKHILNYHAGIPVRMRRPDLTKTLVRMRDIIRSLDTAPQPSTS